MFLPCQLRWAGGACVDRNRGVHSCSRAQAVRSGWQVWAELAIALFASSMVLLFLPKLLSIILVWCKGPKEYGGFIRVTLSLLLEVLFSVLLAPVRMLFHTVTPLVSAQPRSAGRWYGIRRSVMTTLPRGGLYASRPADAAGAGPRSGWHG